MEQFKSMAEQLTAALELKFTPVAVHFSDEPLSGYAPPTQPAAAGCQFWELGAVKALATTASDHANCSIGVYTHNLTDAPASQQSELEQTLAAMSGLDYVRSEEIAAIPAMQSASKHVCYAPLNECPRDPDLVLLFANARQDCLSPKRLREWTEQDRLVWADQRAPSYHK